MNPSHFAYATFFLATQFVFAASSTASPGTIVSDGSVGTAAWTNPGNASASDDSRANASSEYGVGVATEYLKTTNFGFSIPTGATIDGIEAQVERSCDVWFTLECMKDTNIRIVKGGAIGSTNKADTGTIWPTSDATNTYGNSTDLWGETWTASDINNSDFGFVLATTESLEPLDNATPRIDHMQITVYYTVVAEPVPDLSTWAMIFVFIGGVYFLHREGVLDLDFLSAR